MKMVQKSFLLFKKEQDYDNDDDNDDDKWHVNKQYHTMIPAYTATGLFIGTLRMQIIDKVILNCPSTGYKAEIDFHGKV